MLIRRRVWVVVTLFLMVVVVACSSTPEVVVEEVEVTRVVTETEEVEVTRVTTETEVETVTEEVEVTRVVEAEEEEKVLIVAVSGNIDTFDPCCTVGTATSQTIIQNTFDQLTQYAQVQRSFADGTAYTAVDKDTILGMLTESWQQDGNLVTFKLREGLTFHNGDPVNAEAIVEGYRRIFTSGGGSGFLLLMGTVGPDDFQVVDEYTLTMSMEVANNLVNQNNVMHNTSALSPSELAANITEDDPAATDFFRQNLGAGTGPYRMVEYVPDDRIVLEAWDDYYAGRAEIDRVILKIIPDAAQRILLLMRGEVDIVLNPPIRDLPDLEADPNINVISVPTTNNKMLYMNNAAAPFDNPLVRQAVAHAIPYETLLSEVYGGYARTLRSPIADGTPTSDYSFWNYETDLDKAAELLAEAGFPNGDGLPPIKLSIRAGTEEDERLAIFIQDALSQIGVEAEIEKLAFATFGELEQKRELQVWVNSWISWVNDPYYHFSWIYSSTSPVVYTNYQNERVDELISTYTLWNGDMSEWEAASREIQELIVSDAPIGYLGAPNFNVAIRSNVTGYVYYNDELLRFYYMDKE